MTDKAATCADGSDGKEKPEDAMKQDQPEGGAGDGQLEQVLSSAVERTTSALNMIKSGQAGAEVMGLVQAVASDLQALAEAYPSQKVAREFASSEEFDKFVEGETTAILAEQDPAIQKNRTVALGEAITEYRTKQADLPDNAKDKASVSVSVYMDPARQPMPTMQQAQPTGGTPGTAGNALQKGDAEQEPTEPQAPQGDAQPADVAKAEDADVDPMDDGQWPFDLNKVGSLPMVIVGKNQPAPRERSTRPGALGDMTVEQD